MIFFPQDETARQFYQNTLQEIITAEGQTLLGWRTVPVNPNTIGKAGRESQPYIQQVIIGASDDVVDAAFERKLYIIRKQLENIASNEEIGLYIPSFFKSYNCL
ncbi:hypothetical protein GCM10020331_062830 [Ectobacillus funiculus]